MVLESLKSLIPICVAGFAVATGDPRMISSGAVSGVTLAKLWYDAIERKDLKSKRFLAKTRRAILKDYESWASHENMEGFDLNAADHQMARHLADCVPDKETLGALAIAEVNFPTAVAHAVVDHLAKKDALFAEGIAREFALTVVSSALRAALSNEDYAAELRTYMLTAIGAALHAVQVALTDIKAELARQNEEVLLRVPDIALLREITTLVEAHPAASIAEITGDVARFARQYRGLLEQIETFGSTDNALQSDLQAAREALERGDLATARQRIDAAEQSARARAVAPMRDLASVLDLKAQAALIERDWQQAVAVWQQVDALLSLADPAMLESVLDRAGVSLWDLGQRFAGLGALRGATGFLKRGAHLASVRGDRAAEATFQNNLGLALRNQGERLGGPEGLALLAAAVEAYRAALRVYTEANMPAVWAATQNNLGAALRNQGARLGGAEGLALLTEAVEAYRAALRVRTEADMPAVWAMTRENMAIVHRDMADADPPNALAHLRDAQAAVRDALRVYTPEHMPYDFGTATTLLARIEARLAALSDPA